MSDHETIATRRTLIQRLQCLDDQQGWQEFFETYWRLIYAVARRLGLNDAEAQDVVQETMISVARRMPGFHYDPEVGSFKSWLLLITRRRIADFQRRQMRQPARRQEREANRTQTATVELVPDESAADFGTVWDEEWKAALFERALDCVKQRAGARQFQIFDCCVRKEWPVEQVARVLKVTPGQAYLAKHRISALIKKEIQRLESGPG
jgi:RNA polymerase sigma-70 factor (ECF subfamily)